MARVFEHLSVEELGERYMGCHDATASRHFQDGRLFESFLNQNTNKRFLERLRAGVSAALHRSATHSRWLLLQCRNPNTSHHQMPLESVYLVIRRVA
jgi:hypothetical protein